MSHDESISATGLFWGDRRSAYAQLIGDSVADLGPATCFYFDGLRTRDVLPRALTLAERWFLRSGKKPKVLVTRGDKSIIPPRYTLRTLKEASHDARTLEAINSIEVFPKGRTTIDDTWFPSIYFGLRLDRPESAFFYVNEALSYDATKLMLVEGQKVTESFAAYTFLFPQRYAPLGYFWGIRVQPAGRHAGEWGRQESRRLSNWRDNTDIGISSNGSRSVYSVSDGYIRDIYPLMLISSEHLKRKVGRVSLAEAVATEKIGSLTPEGDMFLWRIDIEEQGPARRLLEKYDISLSGHRITPLSS